MNNLCPKCWDPVPTIYCKFWCFPRLNACAHPPNQSVPLLMTPLPIVLFPPHPAMNKLPSIATSASSDSGLEYTYWGSSNTIESNASKTSFLPIWPDCIALRTFSFVFIYKFLRWSFIIYLSLLLTPRAKLILFLLFSWAKPESALDFNAARTREVGVCLLLFLLTEFNEMPTEWSMTLPYRPVCKHRSNVERLLRHRLSAKLCCPFVPWNLRQRFLF